MSESHVPRPVVLCILDGWGEREEVKDNAILQARTPVWDRLRETYPHARLEASEESVGLPKGQFGNSEVGHMNIGAGRVILQDLLRIDAACSDGSLKNNPALNTFVGKLKQSGGACHLIGMVSPGGVHAHQDHIVALAKAVDAAGVPVVLHAILDGRDTPPLSAEKFLEKLITDTKGLKSFRITSVTGRYYAMDRDKRWDRVERAHGAIANGEGKQIDSTLNAVTASYGVAVSDEFVIPSVIGGYNGMKDGDGLLMANYRADRVREILTVLLDPDFDDFPRPPTINFAAALGVTEYSRVLNRYLDAMFPPLVLTNTFGEVVAAQGLTQLRIAETEKYAHVTFFFNGGEEREFKGEERFLVPSPRVATYDLAPAMSAVSLTKTLVEAINGGRFDFIVANYANADMVGHTGVMSAAVKAVETIDVCLADVVAAVEEAGGVMLITADHGNVEQLHDSRTEQSLTSHTANPVPVLLIGAPGEETGLRNGCLADVAPTLLSLMGLAQPAEMTGQSLLHSTSAQHANVKIASA